MFVWLIGPGLQETCRSLFVCTTEEKIALRRLSWEKCVCAGLVLRWQVNQNPGGRKTKERETKTESGKAHASDEWGSTAWLICFLVPAATVAQFGIWVPAETLNFQMEHPLWEINVFNCIKCIFLFCLK